MDDHFRAFSFVDRIQSIEPGGRVCGSYLIPDQIASFPLSLVAEAVGQLAAWAAMAKMDFKCRPVAGIAARVELLKPVLPGQRLDLTADLESVDDEAIAYGGTAHVDAQSVIRLEHCVGPMLSAEEFDDPEKLKRRLELLQGDGAVPGAFGGLPEMPLELFDGDKGQSMKAVFNAPESASFYSDHFPRQPVLPGTLLMNANLQLAVMLAEQFPIPSSGGAWALSETTNMKLRAFTPPGARLEIEGSLKEISEENAVVKMQIRSTNGRVGAAQVHFVPGGAR